ncbi:MAG TPA: TlpA disulfide reductase family protein [Tepidisphaeraceae bacterium]|jgi:thiol-disulfide isomerase/thioredoxin|nr:TlpA disulfide reductase family protein [Tepidisphaeraceae bacterium]
MKSIKSLLILLSISAIGFSIPASHAAPPAAPPAPGEKLVDDSAAQKAAGTDLQAAHNELAPMLQQGKVFGDEAKRTGIAPKALPLIHRIVGDLDTLSAHGVPAGQLAGIKVQQLALLDYFGDADTSAKLAKDATSDDQATAVMAGSALAISHWWKGAHDAAAQQKALDEVKAMVKAHPTDDQLVTVLMVMTNTAPATPAMEDAATKVITDELKGPMAQRIASTIMAQQKLKALEGKPLVISGKLLDGGELSTADWKGKVILVDFWASWCGPCKAELPRVKKAYADYHGKGLEVLGVSCDQGAGPLHAFLDQNPDMPWPQLFDTTKPGWHEIAKGFGINGIPTMFLIDKKGVVRTVKARENFEELIPKMLDEK